MKTFCIFEPFVLLIKKRLPSQEMLLVENTCYNLTRLFVIFDGHANLGSTSILFFLNNFS